VLIPVDPAEPAWPGLPGRADLAGPTCGRQPADGRGPAVSEKTARCRAFYQ